MTQVIDHKREFCKVVASLAQKYGQHEIFADFCEAAALSLRQPWERSPEIEKKYMDIAKHYSPAEMNRFSELLALTTLALEQKPRDFLGECFHELELHNKWKGQFFTPFPVSVMMAKLAGIDAAEETIRSKGFVELNEPTCGSGGMVIAFAEELKLRKINPVNHLWTVAQDVDRKCCCMAYIQMSLLAIPGAVIWGDTLRVECREQWITAGYYLGPWIERDRWKKVLHAVGNIVPDMVPNDHKAPEALEPAPAIDTAIPAPQDVPAGQLLFNF